MPFGYYDVYDHFWIVGGSATQAWSSANQAYVLLTDPQYTNWVAAGNVATAIATEAELWETLAPVVPQLLSNIAGAQVYLEAFYKRISYVKTGRAAFSFDATVIATGQVIKITAPTGFLGSAFQYLLNGVEKFSVDHNGTPTMIGGVVNTGNFTINTALGVGGAAIGGVLLTLNGTTPNILLQDTTASAKSGYIKVDGNKLYIQELADTDGDKVTLDLATGAFTLPNTGLHLKDTNASHTLNIVPGSNLTANRTLTIVTGDANRTLTLPIPIADLPITPYAAIYHSANQSLTTGTWTTLDMNSEISDIDGLSNTQHDTSTNNPRLVCLVAGTYWVWGAVLHEADATGVRFARLRKNGTTVVPGSEGRQNNAGIYHTLVNVFALVPMAVTDYLELQAYQETGSSKNSIASDQLPRLTWFRVGA